MVCIAVHELSSEGSPRVVDTPHVMLSEFIDVVVVSYGVNDFVSSHYFCVSSQIRRVSTNLRVGLILALRKGVTYLISREYEVVPGTYCVDILSNGVGRTSVNTRTANVISQGKRIQWTNAACRGRSDDGRQALEVWHHVERDLPWRLIG